jgi:hypothetical protein
MKKKIGVLLMMLMVVSIIPFALAEEDTETLGSDQETQEEVATMSQGLGAQIRLLQLEKSIEKNILHGQAVIEAIKENGNDTTNFEAIIAEMEDLKAEVKALDPESENATHEFVYIKSDAIALSKEFRDAAKPFLKQADRDKLKSKFGEIDKSSLSEINDEIKDKIKSYNVDQLSKIISTLGMDTSLITQLQNGEITVKDVRTSIKDKIKLMTADEKKEAFAKLREDGVKRNIFTRAAIDKARLNHLDRKEERLNNRLEKASEIDDEDKQLKVQERIQKQFEKLNEKQEKLNEKIEQKNEKKQEKKQNQTHDIDEDDEEDEDGDEE